MEKLIELKYFEGEDLRNTKWKQLSYREDNGEGFYEQIFQAEDGKKYLVNSRFGAETTPGELDIQTQILYEIVEEEIKESKSIGGNDMDNMKFYNQFRNVPDTAKKPIAAGRLKGMTDINPMWRIKVLTEQFGPCGIGWYYKVTNQWIEDGSENQKVAFTNIELYIKVNGEWSMPIVGTGGSSFINKERNGLYTSDECFKMSLTDAISIACKALGIAADVYYQKDRTKYDLSNNSDVLPKNPDMVTTQMLIDIAAKKGYTEDQLKKKYKVTEVKFIKKEVKKEAYNKFYSLPDKKK